MNNWKKTFAVIWAGQFMSILTSVTVNFAIILWLSIETGSAEMLAYAAIAAMLPQAILGPFTGVFIDRWNRKRTMILADSFIAACTMLLALLFWFGVAQMWHIFVLLALRSIGSAFHMPAMQASVPMIAPREQLQRVAGISQIINSVCNIAGPALGALFITLFDLEYVLMLDVLGAAFACTSLLFVKIPDPEKTFEKVNNVLREMKDGLMAVLEKKGLSLIFMYSIIVTFFIMPVSVMFPLMTLDHFSGDEFMVSLIEILWGVGALLGGGIMGAKVYKVNKVLLINAMYLVCGMTFLVSGLLPGHGFVWFAVLTAIGGISGAVYSSSFTAIVQTNIEPGTLGRVFSMYYTVSLLPSLLGLVGIGFFADSLGIARSFVVCGAVIIIVGLAAFMTPAAIKVDAVKKEA